MRNPTHAHEHQHDLPTESVGVTNNQSLWMQSGQQLSSGKRVLYPSDDPLAASQAVMISQSVSENSQYALARTFARQNISMEETVLRSAADGIKDMKTLIVNAGDGTISDNDRDSLATQLQGLKDQLLSQANSTDGNGRFILPALPMTKPRLSSRVARWFTRAAARPLSRKWTPTAP